MSKTNLINESGNVSLKGISPTHKRAYKWSKNFRLNQKGLTERDQSDAHKKHHRVDGSENIHGRSKFNQVKTDREQYQTSSFVQRHPEFLNQSNKSYLEKI